ncbi:MAG: class I SAM-dependent methyltransferase [Burkholderiales bacterium]
MFFPSNIVSIRPDDRVLEIGPGSAPHPRSNAFLELRLNDKLERISQRGGVARDPAFGDRPVSLFDGAAFPFEDAQFDYVICSHVIEHVRDPGNFIHEIFRVGSGRGYLEYPLVPYEYLYDFGVHRHFVKFDFKHRVLMYLPKNETALETFAPVSGLLRMTLESGWGDLCSAHQHLFFEGFEFDRRFAVVKEIRIDKFLPSPSVIRKKSNLRRLISYLENKLRL